MRTALFAIMLTGLPLLAHAQSTSPAKKTIPHVGCPGDNAGEPVDAQSGQPVPVVLPPREADQVASYAGPYGPGLIAPRGWHCFYSVSGDGNYSILVAPTESDLVAFEHSDSGTSSPGVSYSYWDGGTAGRDMVIPLMALFKKRKPDGREDLPPNDPKNGIDLQAIPSGPGEIIIDKIPDKLLEFETPANHDGIGTWVPWIFRKSSLPIHGVVYVYPTGDTSAELFQIRLPPGSSDLRRFIIRNIESRESRQ